MKRILSVILMCFAFLSLFPLNAFAVTEYKKDGMYLEMPDWLIYDEIWAQENSYVGYWHDEGYGFEICIWSDESPVEIMPTNADMLCFHHDKGDSLTLNKNFSKYEPINSLWCSYYNGKVSVNDEYLFDYYLYDFEKDSKHYKIRFVLHDKEYEYFVNEIIQTFKFVNGFSSKDFSFRFFLMNKRDIHLNTFVKAILLLILVALGYISFKNRHLHRERG